MSPIVITPLELNDLVRLRKPHACGGDEWLVVRLGADVGLKCRTCGRRVLLTRRDLERRLVSRTSATPATHNSARQGDSK
ncbi:MAG: DUF951 domain-containing protein [Chloroflexi bacterium]|nr:DUF951 domain-containing protein [Chloroflexota bacterium]